jgi:hypothetical protein
MAMTWRDHCRPIIARVIAEVGTEDRKALREALRAAYPYGVRHYYPYRTWCHEIRVQLGLVKMATIERMKAKRPCEGQRELF